MCTFQCDSCFHKQICSDEPNTRALNEECALYANVKNFTDVQQLQAKIRAVADKLFVCHFQSGSGGLDNLALINELRELSAVQ
jgi:hypothetical protein